MQLRSFRLAALVLALALLAACNGPTDLQAPEAAGPYAIAVTQDPPQLQDGNKATFNYKFTDRATNKLVEDLPDLWGKAVHVVMTNRELNWFQHGATEGPTGGAYPVQVWFSNEGHYNLWTEYSTLDGQRQVYHQTISFGSGAFEPPEEGPAPLNESVAFEQVVYGITVRLEPSNLQVGQHATFKYTFAAQGAPVTDLAPYLDAAGHMYVISADSEEFGHAVAMEGIAGGENSEPSLPSEGGGQGSTGGNPATSGTPEGKPGVGEEGTGNQETSGTPVTEAGQGGTRLGPDITFEHEFEKPGLYKVWAQFLYQGHVITPEFVVRVN